MSESPTTVYVIGPADGSQPWKIGRTKNLQQRFLALQAASPAILKVVAKRRANPRLENWLHRQFKDHHSHGEWFCLPPAEQERLLGYMAFGRDRSIGGSSGHKDWIHQRNNSLKKVWIEAVADLGV